MRLVLTIVVLGPARVAVGAALTVLDIAATFRDLRSADSRGQW